MRLKRVITVDDERQAERNAKGLVSVIDDDVEVLASLRDLILFEGYACETYSGVREFLHSQETRRFPGPRCILSDMCMPDLDGLSLQALIPCQTDQVILFMSGVSDVSQVSKAFRQGALHFLTKPIDDAVLFETLREAMHKSLDLQDSMQWREHQQKLASKLTPREREVAHLIPQGLSIKVMAEKMGISDRAVKIYKQNLMNKLELDSAFELVRLIDEKIL